MEPFYITGKKDTLAVRLDPQTGRMSFEGESYPENALEFFAPITKWIQAYMSEVKGAIVADFKLQYFNSSSSKCLLDIFELLENHFRQGHSVVVNWHYQEDDEDIEESGRDFAEDLSLQINMIAYE